MKTGDIVKHKWGTLAGTGLVLKITKPRGKLAVSHKACKRVELLWDCFGNTSLQNLAIDSLEVFIETE